MNVHRSTFSQPRFGRALDPHTLEPERARMAANDRVLHLPDIDPTVQARGVTHGLRRSLAERMRGPGGLYNGGNLLGLAVGIALQLIQPAGRDDSGSAVASIADYLMGSAGAAAMTVATAVFLCSGEMYHRAWQASGRRREILGRVADLLSGIGAMALCLALWTLGHPVLAITSGVLHAAGKFGNAAVPSVHDAWPQWPGAWPDPFRATVVASRLPAILASSVDLWLASANALAGGRMLSVVTPATLLVCYALWTRADLLLLEGGTLSRQADTTPERSSRFAQPA